MAIAAGSHRLGPDNASLVVKTYREGMASKVGHDLVFEVDRLDGDARGRRRALARAARRPAVAARARGLHGLKPLSDKDRDEILRNIEQKVLGRDEIAFRSRHVASDGDRLTIDGDLTLAGTTRPVGAEVVVGRRRQRGDDDPAHPERMGHQALPRADGRPQGARRGRDRASRRAYPSPEGTTSRAQSARFHSGSGAVSPACGT